MKQLLFAVAGLLVCLQAEAAKPFDWTQPFEGRWEQDEQWGMYELAFSKDGLVLVRNSRTLPVYGYRYRYEEGRILLTGIETFETHLSSPTGRTFQRPADAYIELAASGPVFHGFKTFPIKPEYNLRQGHGSNVDNRMLASVEAGLDRTEIGLVWQVAKGPIQLPTDKNFSVRFNTGQLLPATVNPQNPDELLIDCGGRQQAYPADLFNKVRSEAEMREILQNNAEGWVAWWYYQECRTDRVPKAFDKARGAFWGNVLMVILLGLMAAAFVLLNRTNEANIRTNFNKKIIGIAVLEPLILFVALCTTLSQATLPIVVAVICGFGSCAMNLFFTWNVLDYLKKERGIPWPFKPFFKSVGIMMLPLFAAGALIAVLHIQMDSPWIAGTLVALSIGLFFFMMYKYLRDADPELAPLYPALAVMMVFTIIAFYALILVIIGIFIFSQTWRMWVREMVTGSMPAGKPYDGSNRRICQNCAKYLLSDCPQLSEIGGAPASDSYCSSWSPRS